MQDLWRVSTFVFVLQLIAAAPVLTGNWLLAAFLITLVPWWLLFSLYGTVKKYVSDIFLAAALLTSALFAAVLLWALGMKIYPMVGDFALPALCVVAVGCFFFVYLGFVAAWPFAREAGDTIFLKSGEVEPSWEVLYYVAMPVIGVVVGGAILLYRKTADLRERLNRVTGW